jgi:predicted glutamine amidotransferase
MCGIFGVLSERTITKPQTGFLESAFQAGQVRGPHGSGIFTVTKKGEHLLARKAVCGTEFLKAKELEVVNNKLWDARVAIGHNRFTTSGGNKDDNCHPFKFGEIVGVHNGGIPLSVLDKIDPKESHEVDSGRLYKAISEVDDPLDVLVQVHSGAYSLVWHDKRTNNLYLARNSDRPMHMVETGEGLYFASEVGMLGWLLARHKLLPYKKQVKVGSTDTKVLYTIPMDDPSKVEMTSYIPETAPTVHTVQSNWSRMNQGARGYGAGVVHQGPGRDLVPTPSYVPHKTYHDLTNLTRAHPALKDKVDFIRSILFRDHGELYHKVRLIGYEEVEGTPAPTIRGIACSETGRTDDKISVLADSCGAEFMLKPSLDAMPTAEDFASEEETGYPILQMYAKSFKVLPTGDIIIQGSPDGNFMPELYIYDTTEEEIDWIVYATSTDYLKDISQESIATMWSHLAVDWNDDIPF